MAEKHSVWVGCLSLRVKEDVLSDLFGKFGPVKSVVIVRGKEGKSRQFGYVNYFNREVAECAAHVMNGYELFGQTVKTKGPRELEKLRSEVKQSVGKKDYRMFTDCLFFIDGRDCTTWKSGECVFRHCQKAKETENICEKWLRRQCEDCKCHNRHPRLIRNDSMINESATNRCPSHNAFKCFGECGNMDCNTHFLEQSAYLEHVRFEKENPDRPLSTCIKCQAVFFSGLEQLNHQCCRNGSELCRSGVQNFTSTRVQAEKDVGLPVASYLTKSLQRNSPRIPPSTECRAPLDTSVQNYLNCTADHSTASSSNQAPHIVDIHTPSSFDRFHEGASSRGPAQTAVLSSKAGKDPEPIGVFWDFENCQIPKGKSALAIVQKLRSVFFKERREVEFMCVCDISKEKKAVIEELNKAQVTVVHINSTSKNAADDKLRQSLRRFAQTYCTPATVILISGDGNFAVELSDLRHRHKFHIICLHNAAASSALLGFAHETHRFDLFAEDLETFTPLKVTPNPLLSNDILVTNLPINKGAAFLKARLTQLSDNCGGKVLSVSGTKAVIRFANSEAAFRARRRLDKEELFGSILRATLLPRSNVKNSLAGKHSENEPEREFTNRPAPINLESRCSSSNVNTKIQEENKKPFQSFKNVNSTHESLKRHASGLTYIPKSPILNHHFPNYTGNAMYNNVFNTTAARCILPLPPSMVPSLRGVNPSILASTGPLRPIVNGVVRRSPSPEQQFGAGVDLLVTNINETVSKKEVQKKLASVFREHCKVYSVDLHARSGASLRAFVKVPKFTDAHLAISKVNGKLILGKIVHVSIASDKDKELCSLQDEVVAVLQETLLHWLPLTTFLMNFEKKYRKRFELRYLEQIKDVVVFNGSAGCQTISLVKGSIETEFVAVDMQSFPCDVFKLLHHFEGVMSLTSFPALYWLEFHKEIQPSSSGKILAELLSGLPNIKVEESESGPRYIQWIKSSRTPCDASILMRLGAELVEILQEDHKFEMTISQLKDCYLSTFDKPLDNHGFDSLNDLSSALPAVVEIVKSDSEDFVSLTYPHRIALFAKELEELLIDHEDNTVLFSNFMASYVKYFGQKFKIASFGYSRLTDLIEAIPDVAEIDGIGDRRTVSLVNKKRKACTLQHLLVSLTKELTILLNAATGNEIRLDVVMETYCKRHGRQLPLACYGCQTLEELLKLMSNHFQVVLQSNEKFLQFCTMLTVDKVKENLTILIQKQESKFFYMKAIPNAYEKTFHCKFPYDMPQLQDILQSMSKELQILGNGNDQIVGFRPNAEAPDVDLEFLLAKTAAEILFEYPYYVLPKLKFLSLYRQKLQQLQSICPERKLIDNLPCCVVFRKRGKEEVASLKHEYCIQILIEQLKELLSSSVDMSLLLTDVSTRYQKHYGVNLNVNFYGVQDIYELTERLQGFIEMTSDSDLNRNHRIVLSHISRFEVETQSLLDASGGCISLNRFAPAYQQLHSKACIVADFGYSKLASLLNAVPHVAQIIGNGPEKVVIAVKKTIPERVCTDLLSVRIVNEDNGDAMKLLKEGKVLSPIVRGRHSLNAKHHIPVGEDLSGTTEKGNDTSVEKCNELNQSNKEEMTCLSDQDFAAEMASSSKACISDPKHSTVRMVKRDTTNSPKASESCTSTARPAPQKIRLAAIFKFPCDT